MRSYYYYYYYYSCLYTLYANRFVFRQKARTARKIKACRRIYVSHMNALHNIIQTSNNILKRRQRARLDVPTRVMISLCRRSDNRVQYCIVFHNDIIESSRIDCRQKSTWRYGTGRKSPRAPFRNIRAPDNHRARYAFDSKTLLRTPPARAK